MKDAIELMMEEHRLIEKGLDSLESFVGKVESGSDIDRRSDLAKLAEFIREFADRTHHGKEEDILFEVMVENGFSKDSGPIACMLSEHEEGRGLVKKLKKYAEQDADWSEKDRKSIAAAGRSFVSLLRQHIQKEDNVLYPMAKQQMPDTALKAITDRCEAFEEREKESGENDRLRALGRALHRQHCQEGEER